MGMRTRFWCNLFILLNSYRDDTTCHGLWMDFELGWSRSQKVGNGRAFGTLGLGVTLYRVSSQRPGMQHMTKNPFPQLLLLSSSSTVNRTATDSIRAFQLHRESSSFFLLIIHYHRGIQFLSSGGGCYSALVSLISPPETAFEIFPFTRWMVVRISCCICWQIEQ